MCQSWLALCTAPSIWTPSARSRSISNSKRPVQVVQDRFHLLSLGFGPRMRVQDSDLPPPQT
eukprot:CAMPEP_0183583514 /NCGR_PEP_ID=MMETSP0371-20130417/151806_1 /TAXON_ID=268820 /ORGANISM="Peridinium aciculiferum, Strain PAER-2" /LENGTH=61 /DNA_ID=CAMNT_0025794359 /DNA_START=524 /DNA_END=709 /DNA_ORIENTATION=+